MRSKYQYYDDDVIVMVKKIHYGTLGMLSLFYLCSHSMLHKLFVDAVKGFDGSK